MVVKTGGEGEIGAEIFSPVTAAQTDLLPMVSGLSQRHWPQAGRSGQATPKSGTATV
jgi:hypothetical protein